MTKWLTKSGRFDKAEIQRVDTYLQKEGVSRNELIRKSVFDVVTTNKDVDKYLQANKTPSFAFFAMLYIKLVITKNH